MLNSNALLLAFQSQRLHGACPVSTYTAFKRNSSYINDVIFYLRYKGTREITPSARHYMYVEGDTYTLIINNVYGVDADEYTCRASNKGGSKSTRAELIIMSMWIYLY